MKLLIFFLFTFILINSCIIAQNRRNDQNKIDPKNEKYHDSTLLNFINKLSISVINKDTSILYYLIDSSIITSYGGGLYGKNDFKIYWGLKDPDKSHIWNKLKQVLFLGGGIEIFNDSVIEYRFPYTQLNKYFIDLDFEPHNIAVCINPITKVYCKKDSNSKIIAKLNYEIVSVENENSDSFFIKIETTDKKIHGFVKTIDIYKCNDFTLIITKKPKSDWRISSFAPYD
jgi:hypothetical protein